MPIVRVNVKKLHPQAQLPEYATSGAAAFDIHALTDNGRARFDNNHTFRTGLAFEIPKYHVMLVFSRSGHGFRDDVRLANCVGVIDSDYRGELLVKLTNDGDTTAQINGSRIAQGIILPLAFVTFNETTELSETLRGDGGFGSTGA
jgi:dUTP pyrophosphatase